MVLGLVITADHDAFLGQCSAVGDRVRDRQTVGQFAIIFIGIELARDALTRLLDVMAAEPFRHQLDDDVGQRADQRNEQDDEGPGLHPSGA